MPNTLTAGELHNAALEFYRNAAPLGTTKGESLSKSDYLTAIDTLKEYAVEAGYSLAEVEAQTAQYLAYLERNRYYYMLEGTETLNEGKYTAPVILLDDAVNNGNISTELYNTITQVNEMIYYERNSDEILEFVNSLNLDEYPETDRIYLETFMSVYDSSYDYWNDDTPQNKLSQTDGTIVMDAVGALHGLLLGPVVSIIEGAVCSIAHEHGWWSWL